MTHTPEAHSTDHDGNGRVDSIDALRGLAVAAMIVVNNPGDWNAVFPPLYHAYWTGLTFADLVFPAFVYVMGAGMPLAFARRRAAGVSTVDLYWRTGRRAALLIALGIGLNAVVMLFQPAPLRLPGVLQRIALAYLIASPLVLSLDVRRWFVAIAALLLGHWALLTLVPFDGFPAGTLTPDHNLARYLDTLVFGRHALMIATDPEGLLGTMPTIATALLGAAAGEVIRRRRGHAASVRLLSVYGTAALGLGLVWSRVLPMSKPLWTGSFVLVTAGLATLAVAAAHFIVDVRGRRRWSRPFLWLGVNPLAIYVGSEVVGRLIEHVSFVLADTRTTPKAWLFWEIFAPAFGNRPAEWGSLAYAAAFTAVWIGFAGLLYRWRIRVRV